MTPLHCSVIIPSRARTMSLERLLRSLANQTADPDSFETIVVLDGADEDSSRMLSIWEEEQLLPNLRHVFQPPSGSAAARNHGAEEARAPVLLFLDDDVEATPGLVEAHQIQHCKEERLAVLGDYRIPRPHPPRMYELQAWTWWESKLHARASEPVLRRYTDFVTGNVSLRRSDFQAVGGFDPVFRGYGLEDYELGWRLLAAGVKFVVDPSATAVHHHSTSLKASLLHHRDEGRAEVLLGRKHPHLRPGLRLMSFPKARLGSMCRLAFSAPPVGDAIARIAEGALPLCETLSRRRTWVRLYRALRAYWFWRGVASAVGSFRDLLMFQAEAPPAPVVAVDLDTGIPDPDELLPPTGRGVPIDVTVCSSGTALATVTVPSDIESHVPCRQLLINLLMGNATVRLWLANIPQKDAKLR
jgi:GT2 family glycosyltransferase